MPAIAAAASRGLVNPNPNASWRSLSTDAVEPGQRLDYWMDMISRSFCKLECESLVDDPMAGVIETNRIGSVDLTRLRASGQTVRRRHSGISSGNDEYLIQVQREGRCIVRQDGRSAVAEPGDFFLYDSSRPYELVCDDPSHDVWVLRIARGELERHVADLAELTAVALSGSNAPVRVLDSMLGHLHGEADALNAGASSNLGDAIASTAAACLRVLPGANVKRASNLTAFHIQRVKAYVHQNLRDPELSIASIARAMEMSPDNLCRLFRGEPRPLSRWLWQQRLEACRRELCDPRMLKRSISDIAFSWGFSEAAHFSRSFRQQFGVSAREMRAREIERTKALAVD